MMKTNYGSVANAKGTMEKSIDVKTVPVNSLKDAVIGGGLTLLGVAYIAITSFKNGSKAFCVAEAEALCGVGVCDAECVEETKKFVKNL